MNNTMTISKWTKTLALICAFAAISQSAHAQGRGKGNGKGNGGGPGEELANNLSVPAILIDGSPNLNFEIGDAVAPTGTPLSGYPIDALKYYYVQGVHQWQASTISMSSTDPAYEPVEVVAGWGDNLTGDASLTTRNPIRVEIGLFADETAYGDLTGWVVDKLEPDKLDREAAYGTQANKVEGGGYESNPITPFNEVRVYDNSAWLTIYNKDTGDVVVDEFASAEVNSTGRVVYGYNLRVDTAGTYVIEFTFPNVDIMAADGGTISSDGMTSTLEIDVLPRKGGGGRPSR